jgi:hypothetical protein
MFSLINVHKRHIIKYDNGKYDNNLISYNDMNNTIVYINLL